jgi:DNA replication protein DnaC
MASWEGYHESHHRDGAHRQSADAQTLPHAAPPGPAAPAGPGTGLDYGDFLLSLTELELEGRAENRLKRRLREAKFPLLKTLEMCDYHAAPGLDRRLLHQLASGEYISQQRNVIFLGKSGTGKTHLAAGLGVEACRQGITTRFVTGCGLANELLEARQGSP